MNLQHHIADPARSKAAIPITVPLLQDVDREKEEKQMLFSPGYK